VLVQKQLVVRASRLRMQPRWPHHKNAELMLDRFLAKDLAMSLRGRFRSFAR